LILGAFVGIRDVHTKDTTKAATSTTIERINPFGQPKEQEFFERALANCSAVVTDTNLNHASMQSLIEITSQKQLPLFVGIVSDAKATLHCKCWSEPCQEAFSLSGRPKEIHQVITHGGAPETTAQRLLDDFTADRTSFPYVRPAQLCRWAKAKHVIVTPNKSRFCHIFSMADGTEGSSIHFEPTADIQSPRGNLTGLGDAISASFVHAYLSLLGRGYIEANTPINFHDASHANRVTSSARAFVWPVLQDEAATPGASISHTSKDVPLPFHRTIVNQVTATWDRFQSYILVFALILTFIFWFFGVPLPIRR
jgi:hypothetical protein